MTTMSPCATLRRMGWERVVAASMAAGGPVHVRTVAALAGMQPRSVVRRSERDGWWRPFPSVIALPGTPTDGGAWARAAVLHATGQRGDPATDLAALTRSSALAMLGIQRSFPTRVEVAVPAARMVRPRDRLVVVRSRLLTPQDVASPDGVPVLVGLALLRDLAAVRDRDGLRRAAIDLAQIGLVDLQALPALLAAHPNFPGRPTLRRIAADLLGAGRTDSPFELEIRERLAGEGIELDRGQVPLPGPRPIHLDLGILAIRFGIELHGFGYHARRRDLDRDAARANAIAMLDDDWRVLHATWSVLTDGWGAFVHQVRSAIAAQSRRHLDVAWPPSSSLRG